LYYNSQTGRLERGEAPEHHAAEAEDEFWEETSNEDEEPQT
jgi:hypothetical protein